MKIRFNKILAVLFTALLFLSIFKLIPSFFEEEVRNELIKRYNLADIIEKIEDSGVNTKYLIMVIRERDPLYLSAIYIFMSVIVTVSIYAIILRLIDKFGPSKDETTHHNTLEKNNH